MDKITEEMKELKHELKQIKAVINKLSHSISASRLNGPLWNQEEEEVQSSPDIGEKRKRKMHLSPSCKKQICITIESDTDSDGGEKANTVSTIDVYENPYFNLDGNHAYQHPGDEKDTITSAFVFGKHLPSEEIIFVNYGGDIKMKRKDFACLAPEQMITTEFMNFACDFFQTETILLDKAKDNFFLGHDFVDDILKGACPCIKQYRSGQRLANSTSSIETCDKIHFPLLHGEMWYSVMIDLVLDTIWVFDPSFQENETEKSKDIEKVLKFCEKMLVHYGNRFVSGETRFAFANKFTTEVISTAVNGRFTKMDYGVISMMKMWSRSDGWAYSMNARAMRNALLMMFIYGSYNLESEAFYTKAHKWYRKNISA